MSPPSASQQPGAASRAELLPRATVSGDALRQALELLACTLAQTDHIRVVLDAQQQPATPTVGRADRLVLRAYESDMGPGGQQLLAPLEATTSIPAVIHRPGWFAATLERLSMAFGDIVACDEQVQLHSIDGQSVRIRPVDGEVDDNPGVIVADADAGGVSDPRVDHWPLLCHDGGDGGMDLLDQRGIRTIAARVVPAAATVTAAHEAGDVRLSGVLLQADRRTVTVTATDGVRLHTIQLQARVLPFQVAALVPACLFTAAATALDTLQVTHATLRVVADCRSGAGRPSVALVVGSIDPDDAVRRDDVLSLAVRWMGQPPPWTRQHALAEHASVRPPVPIVIAPQAIPGTVDALWALHDSQPNPQHQADPIRLHVATDGTVQLTPTVRRTTARRVGVDGRPTTIDAYAPPGRPTAITVDPQRLADLLLCTGAPADPVTGGAPVVLWLPSNQLDQPLQATDGAGFRGLLLGTIPRTVRTEEPVDVTSVFARNGSAWLSGWPWPRLRRPTHARHRRGGCDAHPPHHP